MRIIILLILSLASAFSCKRAEYKEREELLYGNGKWYLQKFTFQGRDSLESHLQHSEMQPVPLDYEIRRPSGKDLSKFYRITDEISFEFDKALTYLSFSIPGRNVCLCPSCRYVPFFIEKVPEKWNVLKLDEQVLELELARNNEFRLIFTREKYPNN